MIRNPQHPSSSSSSSSSAEVDVVRCTIRHHHRHTTTTASPSFEVIEHGVARCLVVVVGRCLTGASLARCFNASFARSFVRSSLRFAVFLLKTAGRLLVVLVVFATCFASSTSVPASDWSQPFTELTPTTAAVWLSCTLSAASSVAQNLKTLRRCTANGSVWQNATT